MTDASKPEHVPYLFDAVDPEMAATVLNRLSPAAEDPIAVALCLLEDKEFAGLRPELRTEIDFVLGMELNESAPGRVELLPVGTPFGPVSSRPLDQATDDVRLFWKGMLPLLSDPLLIALLSDVLLTARADTTPAHASSAIAAYLSLLDRSGTEDLHLSQSLVRANTIARSRRMEEEQTVRDTLLEVSEARATAPTGILMPMLDAISVRPRSGSLTLETRDRIRVVLTQHGEAANTVTAADAIAECRRRLATTPEERAAANQAHVDAYLKSADAETGFLRMHWAEAAARLADRYDEVELRDTAVRLMQGIDPDEFDWHVVESDVSLPRSLWRRKLRWYRRARDWREGLIVFLSSSSPAGSHEANVRVGESSANGLLSLTSRTTFGTHNMPERHDDDLQQDTLLRVEQWSLLQNGSLLSLELDEFSGRFGIPSEGELKEWLQAQYSTAPALADQYEKSLRAFWDGRLSDSARISIPLIEAGARGLLLLLDAALYRTERGSSPGRFPSLDFYIEKLEDLDLDIDWARAIRTTLLSPGMNLRNMAAHGFVFEFDRAHAALLIRLAGLFMTFGPQPDSAAVLIPAPPAWWRFWSRIRRS